MKRLLLHSRAALTAGLCLHAAAAFAQTSAPAAASPKAEDAVVLNPFTVTSEKDQGYVATSSLAGTRIKSDLKDLANSITVATKEFLTDVNATDATGLLVYTGNTEVGGPAGNFSGANFAAEVVEHVSFRNPQNNTRIRGLASADLTRDYFPTTITFDSYNTERVEVNRGPNATLFGLGSPGGIVNNQTIQPLLGKNTASVEFNVASFGTTRSVLEADRTLFRDRLGFRFAAVYGDEKFAQDFAFERNRRAFLAARGRPFANANIRVSYERPPSMPTGRAPTRRAMCSPAGGTRSSTKSPTTPPTSTSTASTAICSAPRASGSPNPASCSIPPRQPLPSA